MISMAHTGPVGVAFARVSVDLINASAVFVARLFVQQTFVDVCKEKKGKSSKKVVTYQRELKMVIVHRSNDIQILYIIIYNNI